MELIFNDAKKVHPKHLERCLCWDKFEKSYRCYVYDDISKYWCTQSTIEHDPDGDNHIVDYADYQVTKWASLQQEPSCDTCTNDKGCVTCKDGELWEGKEVDLEKKDNDCPCCGNALDGAGCCSCCGYGRR